MEEQNQHNPKDLVLVDDEPSVLAALKVLLEAVGFEDITGWEEWDLDADDKVAASLGWFDADDYDRQVAGER